MDEAFLCCDYYSLALDTALFGLEHVLSCIVRFTFNDKMTQRPLFLKTCTSSTGEELAVFIYTELCRMIVPFNKLSCVTSDGAANMIGSSNGMISHLKKLIVRDHGIEHRLFESMWCFSHRLNLVIQDFQRVPFIQSVFRFCDWFATKRKAVCYKKWLKETHANDQLRKIPKPSETRWSFYEDVLDVLLSQIKHVNEFLCANKEFVRFKQIGQVRRMFQTSLNRSSRTNSFMHISVSLILSSRGYAQQTHICKNATFHFLTLGV